MEPAKKPFISEGENICEEETNLTLQDSKIELVISIDANVDVSVHNDNICWKFLFITLAKILKCKASTSPFSFYGKLPNY